ncbi:MAG: CopG family transcriptional regulator [Pseudonocardiales bacterium]|nr:MAG: CopG family transcriptional regulator [Pseudonocardiales bacterium]
MTKNEPMTPEQEHDYYAEEENQQPQGPPRRRQSRLTEIVPVRFPPELLDEIRQRAEADDRSLSSWIRRAAEHELTNTA